jgi:4-alpha-glucanotransferase
MKSENRSYDEMIHELADLCGIVSEYFDIFGNRQIISLATQKAILKAMHIKMADAEDLQREIRARRLAPWTVIVEPVTVISVEEQPFAIPVHVDLNEGEENRFALSWTMEEEDGKKEVFTVSGTDMVISDHRWIDKKRYVKALLQDRKQRGIGYYDISIEVRRPGGPEPGGDRVTRHKTKLIIAPKACYIPPELEEGRAWGLGVNLYSIRSDRNWGIGDFGDLERLVKRIADLNGSFVGINPLHAIPNTTPYGTSPYSPISRLYRNFIYLDIEKVLEVRRLAKTKTGGYAGRLHDLAKQLRQGDFIAYEKIASVKLEILRDAFDIFYEVHYRGNTARGRNFRKYVSDEGASLEYFAIFLVLHDHMKEKRNIGDWHDWPEEYRDISSVAVLDFRDANEREIVFHKYVQWLISEQLARVTAAARKGRMSIGLYNDLAIGTVDRGSDAWTYQTAIGDADVGAPPDNFSPAGQNWGFPPMIPEMIRQSGYELFIRTMRANMRYGGALRIDHALGLFRLFWIPRGVPAKDGAYVEYPSQDLLRIIALESVRNRTLVIAEDLGTIGENVRETLKRFSMLSYRLFYFERNYPDPSFSFPEGYPEMALCAVTTHDLPTLYGFWAGHDLSVKRELGIYPDEESSRRQVEERERDKGLILNALKTRGILPDNFPSDPHMVPCMTPELCRAIYTYLAETRCKLVLVSLDDVIGTMNQQNMPGTVGSHPNWIQKTPITLDAMLTDRRLVDVAKIFGKVTG